MTAGVEIPVTFRSGRNQLLGICHLPPDAADVGVVLLVGGPQYRVGSHRMFVLIARELARYGHAVLRFDFTGMGDSEGTFPGFERLNADVAAAIDRFGASAPAVRRFVLLGLCDGATAAAYYAPDDPRVIAAVLLNPWVHTQSAEARTLLWHYYPRRLVQRDFWRALSHGEVAIGASLVDFLGKLRRTFGGRGAGAAAEGSFVDRMRNALNSFSGRLLVVTSERDHTALQFTDLWARDPRWRGIRESAQIVTLSGADHTLSAASDLRSFCGVVGEWLKTLAARGRTAAEATTY